MRHARVKPVESTWYHCCNRVAGTKDDRPFAESDREAFVSILRRVSRLFVVRPLAFMVMSNHFHILAHAPEVEPTEEETCQRYKAYYGRPLLPGTPKCRLWQARLRDVSWFMRYVEQLFTMRFNRTRAVRRRGKLWADRFKATVLEAGEAVWRCWAYIEENPVRAGLAEDAADYRFGSYGVWAQSGRHPYEEEAESLLLPAVGDYLGVRTLGELQTRLRMELARREAEASGLPADKVASAEREAEAGPGFALTVRRRVRYWTDGVAIGSEGFVRRVLAGRIGSELAGMRKLTATPSESSGKPIIFSWARLLPEVS